jgi:type IV pilus assembly protein PilY1
MRTHIRKICLNLFSKIIVFPIGFLCVSTASANLLNLPETPLFLEGNKTALVQLVVERDNKLFFEAYPTYEDINGDGELDIRYKPDEIDYYGYFESGFCYTHTGSYFQATSLATDKKCLVNTQSWSGDFLNYITMTRMDVMLRALYGGKRGKTTPGELNTTLRPSMVFS